jgi:hypothetical protein
MRIHFPALADGHQTALFIQLKRELLRIGGNHNAPVLNRLHGDLVKYGRSQSTPMPRILTLRVSIKPTPIPSP